MPPATLSGTVSPFTAAPCRPVRASRSISSARTGERAAQGRGRRGEARRVQRAAGSGSESPPAAPDPFAEEEGRRPPLRDGPLDRLMIKLFTGKMATQLGGKAKPPAAPSFEDFVDVSRLIARRRSSSQQQATVGRVLDSLLPPFAPTMFRVLFPFRQWSAELNAQITKVGFAWLVGPMEITEHEVEFRGETQTWRSGVKIERCRYLEGSGCVGMCTNMCKMPTQRFFTETFGIPLTMDPNFEDLSCQCVFGAEPPPLPEDRCYSQPCFTQQCNMAAPSGPCPKTDTARASGTQLRST